MKIGLFICDCGKNISGVIDNVYLREFYEKNFLEVHVLGDQYLCSELGLNKITDIFKVYPFIKGLNLPTDDDKNSEN